MLPLTKTVEESDYDAIAGEVSTMEVVRKIIGDGAIVDDWIVSHKHRRWEWGMAIKAIQAWLYHKHENLNFPKYPITVIDVGSGDGMLGPTLEYMDRGQNKFRVIEIEPRASCKENRNKINSILGTTLETKTKSFEDLRGHTADIITCISVIEHIQNDKEFLDTIVMTLRPGGLLFLTTDVVPDKSKSYTFDNLRAHNYDIGDVAEMMNGLMRAGLTPFGGVDLEFKSVQVHDYSFCSLCMLKQ